MAGNVQDELIEYVESPENPEGKEKVFQDINSSLIYLDTYIPEPGVFFYFDNGEMVEVLPSEKERRLVTRRYTAKNWPVDYENMSTTNWKWAARHMQVEGEESVVSNRGFEEVIDYLKTVSQYERVEEEVQE